jgi:superfamily II DNA or RNA helicase
MDHNNKPSQQLHELLSLFPHNLVRPAQLAALEVIARMFTEDNRFTIIEVPTGAGKSLPSISAKRDPWRTVQSNSIFN